MFTICDTPNAVACFETFSITSRNNFNKMHQSETGKNKGTNKQKLGTGQRAHTVENEGVRGTEGKPK